VKVRDLVTNPRPITVNDDDDVALARQAMLWSDVRHLPVMREGTLVGIVSERDILSHEAKRGRDGRSDLVATMMSKPVVVAWPEMDVPHAIGLALDHKIGCLPVLDGHQLAGIVTRTDLIRASQEVVESASTRANGRRVADVMTRALVTAAADDFLLDAVARMEKSGVRHLPVVDGDGRLVGMLSERDVRAAIGHALRPLNPKDAIVRIESTRVGDVMSRKPLTIDEGASMAEAAISLAGHRVGALAIVDAQLHLRGIVSYVDVLRAYAT
jgi:CBS-domain-containing membrane protein